MLQILIQFLLFALCLAQNPVQSVQSAIAGQAAFAGAALILLGALVTFFGYRLLKPTLFAAGFAVFTLLGYIALVRLEPVAGYANRDTVLLLGSLAIGILGGCLTLFFVRFGIAAVGALGGAALALFILSWKQQSLIESDLGRGIFIAVFSLVGSLLIQWLEKPIFIVSSSVGGSYMFFVGIDTFSNVGFTSTLRSILSGTMSYNEVPHQAATYGVIAAVPIMALLGIVFQFHHTKNHQSKTHV